MGNVGGGEILVILLAALLFLGPQKLPDAARQLGKALGEFRKMTAGFQRELHDALGDDHDAEALARQRGATIAATRPEPQPDAAPVDARPIDATPVDTRPIDTPAPRPVVQPGGDL
jgi:Tat protein translocase TatB subunit